MASHAESEEQLGERAPAGVPAIGVDRQGLQARFEDMRRKGAREQLDYLDNPVPESGVETFPNPGVGGEPEVGGTYTDVSETNVG